MENVVLANLVTKKKKGTRYGNTPGSSCTQITRLIHTYMVPHVVFQSISKKVKVFRKMTGSPTHSFCSSYVIGKKWRCTPHVIDQKRTYIR